MITRTFNFNSKDIQALVPELLIISTTPYRYPVIDVTTNPLASADKSVTSSSYFKKKKLNVIGQLSAANRSALDSVLDRLYMYLQGVDKPLILDAGQSTRQWTGTLVNISVSDVLGGLLTIDIEFECSDPFGYNVASTNLFSTVLTSSTSTTNFYPGSLVGSAPWQVPIITITFSAINTGGNLGFTIGNPATGQLLTVTRGVSAADVFEINSRNKTVKVNGNLITDYTGAFPEWATNTAGSMSYSDNFSTRTRTMTGLYHPRYI